MLQRPKCKVCGTLDLPQHRVRINDYICLTCGRARRQATTARRLAKMTPEERDSYHERVRQQRADRSREKDKAHPEKRNARRVARYAISRGKLQRRPCEVCGAAQVQAHHDDYAKPLEVRWLCPPHHRAHHLAERRAALNPDWETELGAMLVAVRPVRAVRPDRAEGTCVRGLHPLSGPNLHIRPNGRRTCRACTRADTAAYRNKKAAQ